VRIWVRIDPLHTLASGKERLNWAFLRMRPKKKKEKEKKQPKKKKKKQKKK
jgi:hypothetical protein